jgi:hypothetical protein
MCYNGGSNLPSVIGEYKELQDNYKENIYWKVLHERDKVLAIEKRDKEEKNKESKGMQFRLDPDDNDLPEDKIKELRIIAIKNSINNDMRRLSSYLLDKSEISIIKHEFDLHLINEAISLINQYHTGLLGWLEMGAADNQISAFIFPYQQFAGTLFETVDRNSHLDIVTKASFIQQFLTRLRNRWTEVETLTSGPGIVFSMKDFNDCIQTLCRGMIKYAETSLRSINETAHIKSQHLQHLVYVKERQMDYYKNKCQNFVNEIDKIINAKMTEKGKPISLTNHRRSNNLRARHHQPRTPNAKRQLLLNGKNDAWWNPKTVHWWNNNEITALSRNTEKGSTSSKPRSAKE